MTSLWFDIVCIGAGGAGIIAAQAASERGASVALISKGLVSFGNTRISGGNIAGVGFENGDNMEVFADNIFNAGEQIGDREIIEELASEAGCIQRIAEDTGLLFRRDKDSLLGSSVIQKRGGHTYNRTLAIPSKGIGLGNALRMAIARSSVSIFEEMLVYKLLWDGECVHGVVCYDLHTGQVVALKCNAVILATGGGSWVYYPHTTNTSEATGDGYSLALSVGAELNNMEQIQFQAFGIARPPHMVGQVLGEPSHAGPGGRLLGKDGTVVLENMNHLTRAQVSRVITLAIKNGLGTDNGGLLLDLSNNLKMEGGAEYLNRFKGPGAIIERVRGAFGEKAARLEEPWEVAPSAHFFMGGIKTDKYGFTGIKGLYATGEAQTGIHGANRLGTVALTAVFVLSQITGWAAADGIDSCQGESKLPVENELEEFIKRINSNGKHRPIVLIRHIQNIMLKYAGPARERSGLMKAIDQLKGIEEESKDIRVSPGNVYNTEVKDAIELGKMLTTAKAICLSALIREETRGAHIRLDFPEQYQKSYKTVISSKGDSLAIRMEA